MRLNFSIWLRVLVLFVSLTACEDPQAPANQRFRLKAIKTIVTDSNTHLDTKVYNYDSAGRLVKTVSSGETIPVSVPDSSRTTVNYNAQGRIDNIVNENWDLHLNASGYVHVWRPVLKTTYEYDVSGNISIIKEYVINVPPTFPSLVKVFQLAYDGTKFPVKVITDFWDISGFKLGQSVEQYTYNGGNIIKVEKRDNQSAAVTTAYQYDDKQNPYYGLITGEPSINIFSKNNMIASDKQYIYDSNGLLTKIVTTTATTEYEYETS